MISGTRGKCDTSSPYLGAWTWFHWYWLDYHSKFEKCAEAMFSPHPKPHKDGYTENNKLFLSSFCVLAERQWIKFWFFPFPDLETGVFVLLQLRVQFFKYLNCHNTAFIWNLGCIFHYLLNKRQNWGGNLPP